MKSFLRYISEDMPHFDRGDIGTREHKKYNDSELTSTLIQRGFIPPTKQYFLGAVTAMVILE